MPRDPLSAENTTAHEHAHVSGGKEQGYGTKDKVRRNGNSLMQSRLVVHYLETFDHEGGSDRQGHHQSTPIENARFFLSVPGGPPGRGHQIARQNAHGDIQSFVSHESHGCPARPQTEHGYDKYIPCEAVPRRTFAE